MIVYGLPLSSPEIWSVVFRVLHFPALRYGPSFCRSCICFFRLSIIQVLLFCCPSFSGPAVHIVVALRDIGHMMSLLNLLALAVDHYIVVCSPMHTFLQRSRKIILVIVTLWVLSAICGLSDFIVSAGVSDDAACDSEYFNYMTVEDSFCRRIYCSNFESEFVIYPLVVGVFVVMAVLYGKVCRRPKLAEATGRSSTSDGIESKVLTRPDPTELLKHKYSVH